ncbi:MAG: D-alanyl-D-alanine carboxypeptidase/D-alanyl-D-alanine-endopeptidase (penicillin-binding protein 4), partial [Ilumatobacter sp.]
MFAVIPAIALFALFSWSNSKVDDNVVAPPTPSTIVDPPLPGEPLRNGLLSFRRMPAVVSRGLNVNQFVSDAQPFLGT